MAAHEVGAHVLAEVHVGVGLAEGVGDLLGVGGGGEEPGILLLALADDLEKGLGVGDGVDEHGAREPPDL